MAARVGQADREAARHRLGIEAERCLLVFGGSQGARSINICALDAFLADGPAARDRTYHVLQITGTRDYGVARERLAAAEPIDAPPLECVEWLIGEQA